MARAVQRPAARRDFIIHYVYLAENAGLDVAKRFRRAVEAAYTQLAEMPGMPHRRQIGDICLSSLSYGPIYHATLGNRVRWLLFLHCGDILCTV